MTIPKMHELTAGAGSIVILGHVHPDGDCVGSCLALYNYLKDTIPEIPVKVYLEDFSKDFRFLSGAAEISQNFEEDIAYDLCICLDSADSGRLGGAVRYLDSASRSVCIDHHVTNPGFADVNIVRAEASSACEVLYELLDPERITRRTAECLYFGIVHDTGVFRYASTSERTMQIAGQMLSRGVDAAKIIDDTFFRKSFVQNQLLGQALLQARLFCGGRMIASVVQWEDLGRFGADIKDTDGIIDQLRITGGVELAMLVYAVSEKQYKISLRSNKIVDVSRIAAEYNGGGHVRAAGGRTEGDPWRVIEEVARKTASELAGTWMES